MKIRRKLSALIALLMLTGLAGCGDITTQQSGSILENQGNAANTEEATKPEVPEGAIVDESGDFVYTGKLQQIGDDENGYIQVPLGYVQFQDEDVDGLTQFSDVTGTNIFTLDYYEGISYQLAAQNMLSYIQTDENIEGVQGATVQVAGYNALQLYGHYQDGFFIVIWFIEDPDNTDSSYYLAIECDASHTDLIACSSTFQTVSDYHASTEE